MSRDAPGAGPAFAEHVRRVGLALRPLAIFLGIVLLGIAAVQIYDYRILGDGFERIIVFSLLVVIPAAVAARTWYHNELERREYFWSLPADRRSAQMVSVAAGWLWVMVAVTVLLARWMVLYQTTGGTPESGRLPVPFPSEAWHYALYYSGTSLIYLLASVVIIVARRKWYAFLWLGVIVVIRLVQEVSSVRPLMENLFGLGRFGFGLALTGRTAIVGGGSSFVAEPAVWATAAGLWLMISLGCVWLAASVYREA